MSSSRTITLFSSTIDSPQAPSSFVASAVAHVAMIGFLSFGVLYRPEIVDPPLHERYAVRRLELEANDPPASRTGTIPYPGPVPNPEANADAPRAPGAEPREQATARRIEELAEGPQTLVQPKAPPHLALKQEIPAPNVVVWSAEKAPAKIIVPPQPRKPTAAEVRPSLEAPNQAQHLSDLGIAPSPLSESKLAILPSTTSPFTVHGPDAVQLAPETTSKSSSQPTPAAVMSLSDLRMTRGTVTLPAVNETAHSNPSNTIASGTADTNAAKHAALAGASGADPSAKPSTATEQKSTGTASIQNASGTIGNGSVARIALPKDGQFGAVVVGSSLEEKYPETAEQWTGRMAYTVYLHVGLSKSWILQYSLPRAAEAQTAGYLNHIDAPWPYNIVRPNLAPGAIDADALMVHGFVNQAGRFEQLSVAFPPEFAQAQFVLAALGQWQFRPAMQEGQATKVEVLLIIPDSE